MATNTELLQQLYVAYYNRPGDVPGMNYYLPLLDAGASIADVANDFGSSQEYKDTYAGMKPDNVIDKIYMNLFGRPADTTGLNFWGQALAAHPEQISTIVQEITKGALNPDGTKNADGLVYDNKVAAAAAFTQELSTPGNEAERNAYTEGKAAVLQLAKDYIAGVTTDASLKAAVDGVHATGQALVAAGTPVTTVGLSTGVDTVVGGAGNDVINGVIDLSSTTGNTFTSLDTIDGKAGTDTLNLNILNGGPNVGDPLAELPSVSVTNVETANIRSAVDLTADVSDWSVTTVNVTQGKALNLTASGTAAVNVAGTSGAVDINGGMSQNISVIGANVTSGTVGTAADDTAGNVTIDVAQVAGNDVVVTGGAAVTVTTTGATTGNTINIGQGTQQATGAVKVSVTGGNYSDAASSASLGSITVKGGTSVEVNQVAFASTANAAADTTNVSTRTQGAVAIDGAGTATTVTVNQSAAVDAKDGLAAVAGVKQAATYTFGVLLQGQTMTVAGLTFTAAKNLTVAEVASAFANLTASAAQGEGKVANGSYTGTFSADWTSAAANGATVTFTAKTAATAAASALAPTAAIGTGSATLVQPTAGATVAGLTNVDAVTGVAGIANGGVTITDSGTVDKIATVKLNGYATGSTIASDALTTLNIANSTGTLAVTNTVQKTLDLTVNGLAAGASVTTPTYETINMHVAGASTFGVTAAGAKSLVVDGSATANISGATGASTTFGNLETVKVNGTAGLNMGATASGTLKSVDTTGTSGTVTVSIDGTKATYIGGAGVDNVTLVNSVAITKAVNLGAGDDTLTFTGTTVPTVDGKIDGGTGTNTLILSAADAQGLSGNANFEAAINNFQKLSIGAVAAGQTSTVDLSNLDDISYVISANGGNGIAETQSFTINSGTAAAVAEQQNFTVTAATGAGTLTVGGVNVVLAGVTTQDNVGAAIVAQKNAIIAANPTIADVTYAAGVVTLVYTTGAGNVVVLGGMSAPGPTGVTFGAVADNFVAADSNAGNMTIGGVNVALTAGMSADQIGAAIAAAQATIKAGVPTIDTVTYNSTNDTVTVTYLASTGNVGPIAVIDAAVTGATFGAVVEADGTAPVGGVALTVNKMANAGTLEVTAAGTGVTVGMTDATGTADSLNLKVTNASSINVGTISAAGVETIALALDDSSTKAVDITAVHTVSIADTALKSLTLTGDAGGIVTHNSNVVTSIDGSALTLSLTAGSLTTATVAATIKGGAGNDILTANHTGDVLIGGVGNDTLKLGGASNAGTPVYANGVTLTGGAGNDIFDISGAGSAVATVNDYATITDFSKGDTLKLEASNLKFVAAVVTTGSTAIFQDLVNKVIKESVQHDAGWFQFSGDTYVVEHLQAGGTSFANGTDNIVKITGQVDLSNFASYSDTANTLLIFG